MDDENNVVYIANWVDASVSVVDSHLNIVLETFTVGNGPFRVALDSAHHRAFVAEGGDDEATTFTWTDSPLFDRMTEFPQTGTTGSPYSLSVHADGFPAPRYAIATGALPAGLSVNPDTGEISGVPTGVGTFDFDLTGGVEQAHIDRIGMRGKDGDVGAIRSERDTQGLRGAGIDATHRQASPPATRPR